MEEKETNRREWSDGKRQVALAATGVLALLTVYGVLTVEVGQAQGAESASSVTIGGHITTGGLSGATTIMDASGDSEQTQIVEQTSISGDSTTGSGETGSDQAKGADAQKIEEEVQKEVCAEMEESRKEMGDDDTFQIGAKDHPTDDLEERLNKEIQSAFTLPDLCNSGGSSPEGSVSGGDNILQKSNPKEDFP